MADVLQMCWSKYLRSLEREPLKTKAITSGVLAGVSDVTAQKLISSQPLNWRRTLAMGCFGLVVAGPANHFWQNFTNRWLRGRKDAGSVLKKLLLDNLVFSPVYNALLMSYIAAIVEGRSSTFVADKLKRDFPPLQLNSWKVWPVFSILIYRYMPLKLRVLGVQGLAFFWSVFVILRSRATVGPAKLMAPALKRA